ncbi:hypothetical protein [uncultured Bacteroides sp.]|uniref:hypothetical protein n=1 Tax=uncultured Bacteroides sp. TaxID=162156 RepID=UPI002AAB20C1|nr:hypothetical protein [uncultured Bacteroides sp.]
MKNYAYAILCIAILLTGCSSSRTTLHSEETRQKIKVDSVQQTQVESNQVATEYESIIIKADSNSYSIIYSFDTEKPVDKSTGLPPVKSICFTGNSKKEEKTVNKKVNSKQSVTAKQSTQLKKDIKIASDITNKTKTKTEFPWTLLLMIWLSAAIAWQFRGPVIKAISIVIKKLWKG